MGGGPADGGDVSNWGIAMDEDDRDKRMRDRALDGMRSTARALASAVDEATELSRRMTEDAASRGDRWGGSLAALQDTRDRLASYELLTEYRVAALRRQRESDRALAEARGGSCGPAGGHPRGFGRQRREIASGGRHGAHRGITGGPWRAGGRGRRKHP